MTYDPPKLLAIDPEGCGCTECLIGEYIQIDKAEPEHLYKLLKGELGNNAGLVTVTFARDSLSWGWGDLLGFSVGNHAFYSSDMGELEYDFRRLKPDDIDCQS